MPPEGIFRRFEMAAWSPAEIRVPFSTREKEVGAALDSVRSASRLRRDRIHTLVFDGTNSLWPHFSWILNESLPDLKHLTISCSAGHQRRYSLHTLYRKGLGDALHPKRRDPCVIAPLLQLGEAPH